MFTVYGAKIEISSETSKENGKNYHEFHEFHELLATRYYL